MPDKLIDAVLIFLLVCLAIVTLLNVVAYGSHFLSQWIAVSAAVYG